LQERRIAARNRPPGSGEVAGEGAGRRGGQVAEDLGGKGTGRRRMADRNQVTGYRDFAWWQGPSCRRMMAALMAEQNAGRSIAETGILEQRV